MRAVEFHLLIRHQPPHSQTAGERTMRDRSAGASILMVEDDSAATDLQDRLISFGHSVRLVASAKDALATFEATHVDLILLSLDLPDTDGLMLCFRFNARSTAPIVIL